MYYMYYLPDCDMTSQWSSRNRKQPLGIPIRKLDFNESEREESREASNPDIGIRLHIFCHAS